MLPDYMHIVVSNEDCCKEYFYQFHRPWSILNPMIESNHISTQFKNKVVNTNYCWKKKQLTLLIVVHENGNLLLVVI